MSSGCAVSWAAAIMVASVASQGMAAVSADRAPLPTEPTPCEVDPGERNHDGFFARSEVGVALLSSSVSDSGAPPRRSRVRGIGQSGGISVGGTPARGWVVGGNVWTARIDPVFVEGGKTVFPDDDSVKETMLRVGPFVDWYPDPRSGFHALASVAFVVEIETDVKGNPLKPAAVGPSASFGAGHEWFLASEFSLGFVGRVALGRLVRQARDGVERTLFVVPELALTATYH